MKKFTALMLLALIVPSFSSAMNNGDDDNENILGNLFEADQDENPENNNLENPEDNAVENPEDNGVENPEANEPAPQPNRRLRARAVQLAQMRDIQARVLRFAQRHAQNNPQEQQVEHECAIPHCDEEATIILPCNHRICRACLTNWATHQNLGNGFLNNLVLRMNPATGHVAPANNTCPECRTPIPRAFIHRALTDNISLLQKTQLRLSLLSKGFLNGLYWGSLGKKIHRWWRSPYLEKTASLGNSIYGYGASILTYGLTQGYHVAQELRPYYPDDPNEEVAEIMWKHLKRMNNLNYLMETGLAIKTKNRYVMRDTLHTNLLFPSLSLAEAAIPYMNKGYAYKLCSRTASKGWSRVGTCLGLYCTNRIYNAYNTWGSRMLTRAGIAV